MRRETNKKHLPNFVVNDGGEYHDATHEKIANKNKSKRTEPMMIPPSNIAALSLPRGATWPNAAPQPPTDGHCLLPRLTPRSLKEVVLTDETLRVR